MKQLLLISLTAILIRLFGIALLIYTIVKQAFVWIPHVEFYHLTRGYYTGANYYHAFNYYCLGKSICSGWTGSFILLLLGHGLSLLFILVPRRFAELLWLGIPVATKNENDSSER